MAGIGEKFKTARRNNGLTLEDVCRRTKLSHLVIRSIEEEDFRKLPSHTYVIGFLRVYCKLLGLDDKEIVTEYIQQYKEASQSSIDVRDEMVSSESRMKQWRFLVSCSMALIISVAVYFGFKYFYPVKTEVASKSENTEDAKSSKPEKTAIIGRYERMMMDRKEPAKVIHTAVTAKILKDVFVSVSEKEEHLFSGILKGGTEETWHSEGALIIKIGIPDAVQLFVKDKDTGIVSVDRAIPNMLIIDGSQIIVSLPEKDSE